MSRISACLLSLVLVTNFAGAADWPQFRGAAGQGVSSDTGLPTTWSASDNVVWKAALPGAGTSSPIFVGNRIYLTAYRGYNVPGEGGGSQDRLERLVLCLNRQDGKIVWTTPIPSKLPEQERIRENHGYASSTPVSDGQRIYCFFGKAGVFALDTNGKIVWRADVGDGLSDWGSAASPILHDNLLIVNASVESQSLVALDKNSGKEVWRARGINQSWNTPIVVKTAAGQPELVVAIMGDVLGFDPVTGEKLWSCRTDIPWYMVPSLVSEKDVVYCIGGRGSGGGLAVKVGGRGNVTDSHRLWIAQKGSNVSSPLVHQGHLYWGHETNGIVYCADLKTGRVVYEERLPRAAGFYASPVLAEGKIYYVARNGRTFVVAARPQFELLGNNDLGERAMFNSSPVVADGRLFLRFDKTLYCLDQP